MLGKTRQHRNARWRGTARYVVEKSLAGGRVGYYFQLPKQFLDASHRPPCPVGSESLGTDREAAIKRAKEVLLPAFDAWLRRGENAAVDNPPGVARFGTLDWVFAEYRKSPRGRFKKLSPRQRRNHENGYRLVVNRRLDEGRGQRIGDLPLKMIDTAFVDALYENLLVVIEVDADGNVIKRERRTTVNTAMKSWRRAWKVAARANPGKVPLVNPFAAMGLQGSKRKTPTATFEELQIFRAKAVEKGFASLATAALVAWELVQREADVFGTFDVTHYRPKEHPNLVRVIDEKTGEEGWVSLFDEHGAAVYPELMAELDAIKRSRIAGLMICRDRDQRPWPTWPQPDTEPDLIDLTHMSRTVKSIIKAAGLRDELTFASFRHGASTEMGDAELTDREIMAQGRWASPKVLPNYVKRTMRQVVTGAKKRRASRTKSAHDSE